MRTKSESFGHVTTQIPRKHREVQEVGSDDRFCKSRDIYIRSGVKCTTDSVKFTTADSLLSNRSAHFVEDTPTNRKKAEPIVGIEASFAPSMASTFC